MPIRNTPLIDEEYYHVYNRGVAKQPIFVSERDYEQAVLALDFYRYDQLPIKLSRFKQLSMKDKARLLDGLHAQDKKLVEILAYVYMPNHFHLLLKQKLKNGISTFIRRFSNSYSRYFNTKHDRNGPLFQGVFKTVHIETEEQLIHLSRYIHLNPYVSGMITKDKLTAYTWSSLPTYIGQFSSSLISTDIVLSLTGVNEYEKFVFGYADYAKELELIKHLVLDISTPGVER